MIEDSSISTAFFTDQYELTMLESALHDGTAARQATFEVFTRRLPPGRRYGVVCGIGRFLTALKNFTFTDIQLNYLSAFLAKNTLDFLANFSFTGDIDGYREGDVFFPYSPIVTVRASFAHACVIETLLLSILNHDCAIASAAARMATSAKDRELIEMGSRRTHERAAIAAARAAYIGGFSATSNLAASAQYNIPGAGTAGHAFTLLHAQKGCLNEREAFAAQVAALGKNTTLLVDTYDITQGVNNAIAAAGPNLGAVRIDSGDLGILAEQVRSQLNNLGAYATKIVVSGDLDEYSLAGLQTYPIDTYGVGTSIVTGSGHPTAGLIYKLVDIDGISVAKRSSAKNSRGGIKRSFRIAKSSGTVQEEIHDTISTGNPSNNSAPYPTLTQPKHSTIYPVQIPFVRNGEVIADDSVETSRVLLQQRLASLPWEALSLTKGDPIFISLPWESH